MSFIENKVVVITGASSGIGEATASYLAEKGAKVVLAARSENKLQQIVNRISSKNGIAVYKATDATNKEEVQALIDYAIEKFDRVDTLINCAGLMLFSMWDNAHVDEWEKMIDLNLKGTLYGIAAVLPHMKQQGKGQIINVGSIAGHAVGEGHGVYSATKFAVKAITESLRKEVSVKYNIQASMVSPGVIATNWQDTVTDSDVKGVLNNLDEVAIDVDHVAKTIAFVVDQPSDVLINDVFVTPTAQEW
ncbi:SDR family oxidoreductase [Bacillus subtilis]|uniref:SDR family oxidoreductase n=1 Tax=Bacillus subtilis TaxID=1423 RepID=UPI001293D6F0|nr:SDR family oxidoreductase [Bacillus subtilis]MCP6730566.1 SDR family oxidoreductase [Bacillus subtilis]MDP0484524.1 SDR family oxidoreductase [Bacillus subtilis]QFY82700.1 SDR family oxidoreductase [Bacillus subtilis]